MTSRTYLLTWVGLLALTALTTAVAFLDLGVFSTVLAVGIAGTKALLIGLFFMHLLGSPYLVRVITLAAVLWLAILLLLTMGDYVTRGWLPVPGK